MITIAVVLSMLPFLAIAGANMLVSSLNPDELNNMGVDKKA
jgi:hypothetical protein